MLAKRIIACLDVRSGRVVKGVRFGNLKNAGSPAARAAAYEAQGADEIVVLDVSATRQKRLAFAATVRQVASALSIPLTVGGGIRSLQDAEKLFRSGADKVSLNTAAVQDPALVRQLAREFGSQSVVVAIDSKQQGRGWNVFTHAGTSDSGLGAVAWAKQAEGFGTGELLVTSMDRDGTRQGFDMALLQAVKKAVRVPVVASGGAGKPDDFRQALQVADAALAAGVLHSGKLTVGQIKTYLKNKGSFVRV
ncbi:imidazole glycerol phosphate synthase subunit HisF [Candidatus Micrarchaeota archaeon]|nr:imidazole glycerol phosphate synthase subunit HisF [Candidatus Micrarchaeota archaeon]